MVRHYIRRTGEKLRLFPFHCNSVAAAYIAKGDIHIKDFFSTVDDRQRNNKTLLFVQLFRAQGRNQYQAIIVASTANKSTR
jgi:hypothetical protein